MSKRKGAIATLAIASTLAISTSLVSLASANSSRDPHATVPAALYSQTPVTEMTLFSAKTEINSWTTTTTTCANAQETINNVETGGEVRIIEDCSANLIIPSGKLISLSLYSEEEVEIKIDDENTQYINQRTYHTLSEENGDTITVEEGASLYLLDALFYGHEDQVSPIVTVSNATSNRSIINNHGVAHIQSNLMAENGANIITNTGKLYTLDANYAGGNLENIGDGKLYIAEGIFTNVGDIQPYLVNGVKINTDGKIVSTLPNEKYLLADYNLYFNNVSLPVGYSYTVKTDYADYADAREVELSHVGDESVLNITGSNQEGWTFTIVGVGTTSAQSSVLGASGDNGMLTGYQIDFNISGSNMSNSVTQYLAENYANNEELIAALEAGKAISIDTGITPLESLDETQTTLIKDAAVGSTIANYFDITLSLNATGEDGEKTLIDNITDLGDNEDSVVEIRISTDELTNIEELADGYDRIYYAIRLHDGEAERIDVTEDKETQELIFYSGKFSTYAIAYTDTKNTPNNGNTGPSSNPSNPSPDTTPTPQPDHDTTLGSPNTGILAIMGNGNARIALIGVLSAAITSGLATYRIARKKQKSNR